VPHDHAHHHDHARHAGDGGAPGRRGRALGLALAVTAGFTAVEAVAGLLTGSLALLADAGHMLSDNVALALALGAIWLAGRPPTAGRSFGFRRAEIIAALVNGVGLVAIAIWIFVEAGQRLGDPSEVEGGWVLVVAALGLVVNIVAARLLFAGGDSLNVRAAFLHVLGDLAASVGVIVGAVIILTTGWRPVDPLVSILIGLLILVSSWSVLRESVDVLLEAAPRGVDVDEIGRRMASVAGVAEVHDLHVWTITSGFTSLSAHLLVERDQDCHARRRDVEELLRNEYAIAHTTLQADHLGEGAVFVPIEEVTSPRRREG
jgi:cobalt-zinc-cadmium efflux system protein